MEEIIGLLIIVATFVFKIVGKKLEKAGQPAESVEEPVVEEPAGGMPDFDVKKWLAEAVREAENEASPAQAAPAYTESVTRQVVPAKPAAPTKPSVSQKPAATKPAARKPMLNEPVKKDKEKIDLKKMIIYSEIMSPKYNEK